MPTNSYTYTLSLNDKMSGGLKQITGTSNDVIQKFKGMSETQKKLNIESVDLGGSLYNLENKLRLLRSEKSLIDPKNVKDIAVYNKEIGSLEKQIIKLNKTSNGICDPLSRLNLVAKIQQAQALSDAISNISTPGIGFNQSMADLSSITGITGDELKQLGEVARKTGAESGMGAAQGAKAFEFLASQIDVSKIGLEGLKELQTKTITLAQAAGMTMGDSAMALAGTINQFGLSADQAGRVINVLAAGSKYGAAEITELSQSFKVVGAAANAAGLSVEGTAGAIEVLSKNNLKGAEAGTALRNIILKMQTELGVDFSKTSLGDALEMLKPKLKDATYLSKLFGMENIAAAQFMIGNTDAIKEMTDRVTDTNVAQEQAAIRTDTWQHKMDVARAKIDDFKIGLFGLAGGVGTYGAILSENIVTISQLIPLYNLLATGIRNLFVIDAVTGKLRLLTIAKQVYSYTIGGTISAISGFVKWIRTVYALSALYTTKQWAQIAVTNIMTASQWALNLAMSMNPIVWVVGGVMLLVGGIVLLWNKCEGFRKVVLGTWEVMKSFGTILIDAVLSPIKNIIGGLGSLGSAIWKLFTGDFKGAATEAKEGVKKLFAANPISVGVDMVGKFSKVDMKGDYAKGAAKAIKVQSTDSKKQSALDKITPSLGVGQSVLPNSITNQSTTSIPEIISDPTLGKVNLNNTKGTTNYAAITAQLVPITVDSIPQLASPMGIPTTAVANNQQPQAFDSPLPQSKNGKTRIEKICEVLNINIASADDKGYEQIKDEIIEQLQIALG